MEAVCYLCTKITSQAIMSGSKDTLRSCSNCRDADGWATNHCLNFYARKVGICAEGNLSDIATI